MQLFLALFLTFCSYFLRICFIPRYPYNFRYLVIVSFNFTVYDIYIYLYTIYLSISISIYIYILYILYIYVIYIYYIYYIYIIYIYIIYIYIYIWMAVLYWRMLNFFENTCFSKNLLYKTKSPDISKSMIHENVTNELKKKHL